MKQILSCAPSCHLSRSSAGSINSRATWKGKWSFGEYRQRFTKTKITSEKTDDITKNGSKALPAAQQLVRSIGRSSEERTNENQKRTRTTSTPFGALCERGAMSPPKRVEYAKYHEHCPNVPDAERIASGAASVFSW